MTILKNKFIWITLSIIAVVAAAVFVMPKPIDMDLEKIGKGQNAVVFIYDPNSLASNRQSTEMNKARTLIGEQAIFLIAKAGDPNAEGFRKRYQAQETDLLFFNGAGELIERQFAVLSAEELIEKLINK